MKCTSTKCKKCIAMVGPVSFWGNLGLTLLKVFVGILSGSKAVVADGIHSLADVFMGIMVLLTLKISRAHPDKQHNYGHGKIEFIAALVMGSLLLIVALVIVFISLQALLSGELENPTWAAVWVTIISILGNEIMARHSLCASDQTGSTAMKANAMENRADVISSIAALVGVAGAKLGFRWLDPIAAVAVAALITHSAFIILKEAIYGLLDKTACEKEIKKKIIDIMGETSKILNVDYIWSRRCGQETIVDIGACVVPELTVSDSNILKEKIRKRIYDQLDAIMSIMTINIRFSTQD